MSMYMPGATAVGITFDGGVVFASEKRIAFGNFLVSKTTKKTFSITDKVGATCAGLVADMQILTLQISALAKIRKMDLKRDVPPNTVAKMMSNMMYERRYFPLLTQVIVGGVVDKPVMYTLDPLGSVLPDEYAAVGKAMVSSSDLEKMEKGEVIQNIHYISDKFWETGKTIYN